MELSSKSGNPVSHNQFRSCCPVTRLTDIGRLADVRPHKRGDQAYLVGHEGRVFEFWTASPAAAQLLKLDLQSYIASWEDDMLYLRHPSDPLGRTVQHAPCVGVQHPSSHNRSN